MLPRKSSNVCIFTAGFFEPEMRPREQRQAQIDGGGGFQRVNGFFQIDQQTFAHIKPPRLRDQSLGEFSINAPITGFIGVCQSRPPDRPAKTHMVKLRGFSRQARLNVAKALPGMSVGRTPLPGTVRHMERFARRSHHRNARRAEKTCSRAGNPSAARIPSFRRTSGGPSPEKEPTESDANLDATPSKIAENPFNTKYFLTTYSW